MYGRVPKKKRKIIMDDILAKATEMNKKTITKQYSYISLYQTFKFDHNQQYRK